MKQESSTTKKVSNPSKVSNTQETKRPFKLTPISEEKRERLRIPAYPYILP